MRGGARHLVPALLACACASPGALPSDPPLRDARIAPTVPDALEHGAADLAAAALAGDRVGAAVAAIRIDALDAERPQGRSGLAPAAADLLNAAALPLRAARRASRRASQALLERDDLDPALRERVERELADDPLVRARARLHDARVAQVARAFNALVEPVGRSLLSMALAPYRLGRSLAQYGLDLYRRDPLPLERRQALARWKEFLARYPNAPESAEVSRRAEAAEIRWHQTQRKHALAAAETALREGRPREALVFAERALQHSPEHAGAEKLRAEAERRLRVLRANRRRSLEFALPEGGELVPEGARDLAIALLAGRPPPAEALREGAPLRAEARFARAGWLLQTGDEEASWDVLRTIASGDAVRENMARHAQAALADTQRNPYDTFVRARWRDRRARALWLLVGPFAEAPWPRDAVGAIQALLGLPRVLQVAVTLPLRMLQLPWKGPPTTAKVTAVEAHRYLRLEPDGVHAREIGDWLEGYERSRDNPLGALRIAEQREPAADHTELREEAARQTLRVALKEERSDLRRALLAGVVRRFPGTEAGDAAGRRLRTELEESTPHRIRISRGFLAEHPEVAGVGGLDLDPALLDGDGSNGELHPDGIALIGGRMLEISYLAASGDDDDPPEKRREHISQRRLARLVARLEETSFRAALLDDGDPIRPDAYRDQVFERARLGLADDVDSRATARADFVYRGIRERYGVVRRREPLLPFDIVVQGSLSDLSLGAFPRMRMPERTEDALLYE